ncbi:hypothetical protein AAMO2058_000709700 [Amorphochlora amoebiformis]|eukprot:1323240-Amorphochlora_amoeboformis.AAC.1
MDKQTARRETLETMNSLSGALSTLNENILQISEMVQSMDRKIRSLEGKMDLMYTPFMTSMYQYHQKKRMRESNTNSPPFKTKTGKGVLP